MNKSERFWVEKRDADFPIYRDESCGMRENVLLALGFLLTALYTLVPRGSVPFWLSRCMYFLLPTVPFLIAAKGKIRLLVKRFRFYDPVLILIGTALCFFAGAFMAVLLINSGLINADTMTANPAVGMNHDGSFFLGMLVQIFGEEMLKIDAFLAILMLIDRRWGKRKAGIIVGMVISALLFGLLHYRTYGNLLQVLCVQGSAGLVLLYLYLRTKNVFVPFWAHVLSDCVALLGSAAVTEAVGFML